MSTAEQDSLDAARWRELMAGWDRGNPAVNVIGSFTRIKQVSTRYEPGPGALDQDYFTSVPGIAVERGCIMQCAFRWIHEMPGGPMTLAEAIDRELKNKGILPP